MAPHGCFNIFLKAESALYCHTGDWTNKVLKLGNISPTFLAPRHQVDSGGNCNSSKWQMAFRFLCQILKKSVDDGEFSVNATAASEYGVSYDVGFTPMA